MILDDIVSKKKITLEKNEYCFDALKIAESVKDTSVLDFYEALSKDGLSIIGEVKKASPSRGVIKDNFNPVEIVAWSHAEFVRIHPFIDGNGRTARLIMDYQLMVNGFLPVSINKEDRLEYYNTLEEYAVNGNLKPFVDMVSVLEDKQLDSYISLIK